MIKKLLLSLLFISFNYSHSQNNYLDFDGINDFVNVPNSGNILANATAITMSCKVYPKSNTSGFPAFNGFAGFRNESNFDFYLIQLSTTEVEARFRNSNGTAYSISYNGLVLNQWNHFFLVYNGSTLKLYSGTTEVGSVTAAGAAPASNTSTFKIGLIQYQAYNWYHNGYIDETSLWNKALSPTEISAIIANNGEIANPQSEANLKVYYKFNQGIPYGNNTSITTLTDEMTTLDGTVTNFALTGNTSNWGSATLSNANFESTISSVYPNPASSILNIISKSEITSIQIVDLSGRIILNKKINATLETSVDVGLLNQGIYMAIINNSQTIKFVKK